LEKPDFIPIGVGEGCHKFRGTGEGNAKDGVIDYWLVRREG